MSTHTSTPDHADRPVATPLRRANDQATNPCQAMRERIAALRTAARDLEERPDFGSPIIIDRLHIRGLRSAATRMERRLAVMDPDAAGPVGPAATVASVTRSSSSDQRRERAHKAAAFDRIADILFPADEKGQRDFEHEWNQEMLPAISDEVRDILDLSSSR
jgi:hypothetical protein